MNYEVMKKWFITQAFDSLTATYDHSHHLEVSLRNEVLDKHKCVYYYV